VQAALGVTGAPALAPEEPLSVTNLHNTLPGLARLVVSALERESWLDAYLLAVGMSQLIDDHLAPDPLSLRRIGSFLAKEGGSPGAVAAWVTARSANGLDRFSAIRPGAGRVRRLQAVVQAAADQLAQRVVGDPAPLAETAPLDALTRSCEQLSEMRLPRALREDIARLPACFRSFDQHPDDLRRLVRDFALAHPDRHTPLLVVGIRTSGSYLAPLYAAFLRAAGYSEVDTLTMRPGRRPGTRERSLICAVGSRGGLALVCDDPPGTGGSIARVAASLEGFGVPRASILLLLALFPDTEELAPALADYESVLLRFDDWSIHARLGADAVRDTVERLLGPDRELVAAERLSLRSPRSVRGHLGAVFNLTLADAHGGGHEELQLSVEGVGLGYFGNHAIAVADPLREYFPSVLGVEDGLLYRAWMPDTARADLLPSSDRAAVASRIAGYVFERHRRLAVEQDVTLRQSGQYPAWEAASTVLSRSFGRAWPAGRKLVTDRVAKRLLHVQSPSDVDGRLELTRWFADAGPASIVKVDWDQGSSWNLGLGCCDPVFDLAGVTAASQDTALSRELQRAYEALAGEPVEQERWLLYQLAQLTVAPETRPEGRHALRRACSRAMQNYFGRVYFDDLTLADDGPLCGIDIDGVLETEYLGFPALSPASAGGLRALIAHGYRPLIVTGRSLGDVVERCAAYRLAGAVSEYGSAIYTARDELVTVVSSIEDQDAIARLRAEFRRLDGVTIDDDYTHAIRAFVRDSRGARGPLPHEMIAAAQRVVAAEQISAVEGDDQTDFVPRSIDKGRGVRALVSALAAGAPIDSDAPLAFAVGDTATDIPMLALAKRPFAPAHGRQALGGRFTVTRGSYQKGFAEAVGSLLGHAPGSCAQCALPTASAERRLLLGVLAVRERGIRRLPSQVLKLMPRL
jgi:hydroxymethylpyrimidine pyrophosphatase-like HAD family hydrolase